MSVHNFPIHILSKKLMRTILGFREYGYFRAFLRELFSRMADFAICINLQTGYFLQLDLLGNLFITQDSL